MCYMQPISEWRVAELSLSSRLREKKDEFCVTDKKYLVQRVSLTDVSSN